MTQQSLDDTAAWCYVTMEETLLRPSNYMARRGTGCVWQRRWQGEEFVQKVYYKFYFSILYMFRGFKNKSKTQKTLLKDLSPKENDLSYALNHHRGIQNGGPEWRDSHKEQAHPVHVLENGAFTGMTGI